MNKYKIAQGKTLADLISVVNSLMSNGWKPSGSPVILSGWYGQAMVKE